MEISDVLENERAEILADHSIYSKHICYNCKYLNINTEPPNRNIEELIWYNQYCTRKTEVVDDFKFDNVHKSNYVEKYKYCQHVRTDETTCEYFETGIFDKSEQIDINFKLFDGEGLHIVNIQLQEIWNWIKINKK